MSSERSNRPADASIGALIASLSEEQLRELVGTAADTNPEVERALRLLAARAAGDLGQLRVEWTADSEPVDSSTTAPA